MSLTEQLHTHAEPHAHGKKGGGLFSRRIGPLSAGAWLGVIVGGVALGMYAKKHGPLSGGSSSTAADPAADPGVPADPGGLYSPGAALDNGSSTAASSSSGSASLSSQIIDNSAWEAAAIKQLIVNGVRPGIAQPAIVGFLSGTLLTAEQGAAVEQAIRLLGSPPDGAPALMVEPAAAPAASSSPTSTNPAVPSKPAPTAPAPRPVAPQPVPVARPRPIAAPHPGVPVRGSAKAYTVKSGDTLSGIAASHHLSSWQSLYTANAEPIESAARRHGRSSSDHGHWIYPGTVLRLP